MRFMLAAALAIALTAPAAQAATSNDGKSTITSATDLGTTFWWPSKNFCWECIRR